MTPCDHNDHNTNDNPIQEKASMTADTATHACRMLDAATLAMLRRFIGAQQMAAIHIGMLGEERAYFIDKLIEIAERIAAMPSTYGTEGQGMQAVAHLHYFVAGFDCTSPRRTWAHRTMPIRARSTRRTA
jgi:hypothetical protein